MKAERLHFLQSSLAHGTPYFVETNRPLSPKRGLREERRNLVWPRHLYLSQGRVYQEVVGGTASLSAE
jgi:hypothetical protein